MRSESVGDIIMKKTFLLFLIFTSIAFLAGLTSCLSSQVTLPAQATVTFPSTEYLSSTPTIAVTPTWSGNYADEIATVSAAQTHAANFPHLCDSYFANQYSPDRSWLAELCYSKNDHDLVMTLANSKTQVLWKLLYQEYIPKMDFVPDGGMSVVHWSNDGKYAYFTAFLGGDGGECFYGNQLETGTGLFRLDLQTGRTAAILPLNDNDYWYSFSISPTERRLVYGVHSLDLKILDITTGQLIEVAHHSDFSDGGGYVWSPDGLKFVYSTVTSDSVAEKFQYSLRLVDAQSGSERILLESPDNCFAATSWTENNMVMIEKNFGEAFLEFDLNSNKIASEATVTPYP
jgi:hypothetical protein